MLPANEYNNLINELEELEDIKLYVEAKKRGTGEGMLFSEYVKNRKLRNA